MKNLLVYISLLITPTLFSIKASAGDNLLYNNGSLVTQSGTGVAGADESVLENVTLSMTSFGTAHSTNLNLRVADEFTITGSSWQIDTIDFYAYQTGELASTITEINLRIWDGVPGGVDSQIVFGDSSTNILTSTTFSGILRVDENTQGTANDRQIAISNVTVDVELEPGTYWLDWQSNGTGSAGPFVPHITITGQVTTGNALLSTDNGSTFTQLIDNGTLTRQGLPFIINGSVLSGPQPTVQSVPSLNFLGLTIFIFSLIIIVGYKRRSLNF